MVGHDYDGCLYGGNLWCMVLGTLQFPYVLGRLGPSHGNALALMDRGWRRVVLRWCKVWLCFVSIIPFYVLHTRRSGLNHRMILWDFGWPGGTSNGPC
jgi:hypothetical protein